MERDQLLVIRKLESPAQEWCADCDGQPPMVSVREGAAAARLSERAIHRRVENGQVHFSETLDGWLLICLNSLLD